MRPWSYLVTAAKCETSTTSYQQHCNNFNLSSGRDVVCSLKADTRVLIVAAMSGISPSASGLLPMPGAPSSSWAAYKARAAAIMGHHDTKVIVAFWLFGTILPLKYLRRVSNNRVRPHQ